jgi:hypothetical protein
LGTNKERLLDLREDISNRKLAETLGIAYEELVHLHWTVQEDCSDDGLLYGYILDFSENEDIKILQKIKGLDDSYCIYLSQWQVFEDIDASELLWEIETSDQLRTFHMHMEYVETLLKMDFGDHQIKFNVLVMLYVHIIASIEQYLSSVFLHKVTNSDELTRKLIETDPEFGNRKFTLNQIYAKHKEIKIIVADYLKSLIFHDLKKIKPMYKSVLGIDFGNITWLFSAINIRHDCAHRAGYSKEGNRINLTADMLEDLIEKSKELILAIEYPINDEIVN